MPVGRQRAGQCPVLSQDTGSSCSAAATTSASSTPRRRSTRPRLINRFIRELSLIEQLLWPRSPMARLVSEAVNAAAALHSFRPHPFNAMTSSVCAPSANVPRCGSTGD